MVSGPQKAPSSEPAPPPRSDAADTTKPPSTAKHVDELFKKWTRYISHKLKAKNARNHQGNAGEGQANARGVPPLDLDSLIEIAVSVMSSEDSTLTDKDRLERGSKRSRGKQRELKPPSTLDHNPPLTHEQFLALVTEAHLAISHGVHPRLNAKGSSGSYFVRNPGNTATLAIFKPSDEDPYGAMNPKLVKYLHRTLHHLLPRVIPFGRSCLIPGQSYASESAASVLDRHLGSHIVPRTEVVALGSRAFYYDWIERERAEKYGGDYKEKEGSFQVFLEGFTDASDFLTKHPYPPTTRSKQQRTRDRSCWSSCFSTCASNSASPDEQERDPTPDSAFEWTSDMVESFQLELEKLVILDYLIRNTDRGLDNFMIKACHPTPSLGSNPSGRPHVHLAAIDNSLAFPHTHPQGWRQFPYGWLYLPLPLLDHPWSDPTRLQYLDKLEDPEWWSRLHLDLRSEFLRDRGRKDHAQGKEADEEEDEMLWRKQWSLIKGQGWNLVQSLREAREGPLELCRRRKVLVSDGYVLVSNDEKLQHVVSPTSRPLSVNDASSTRPEPPPAAVSISYSRPLPSRTPTRRTTPSLAHRRTLSDYSASYGTAAMPSNTETGLEKSAQSLRKPLDALAAQSSTSGTLRKLLRRNPSSSSTSSATGVLRTHRSGNGAFEENGDEEEEAEETGFTFLKNLDHLEAVERKRARRIERSARKLGLLDNSDRDPQTGKSRYAVGRSLGRRTGTGIRDLNERSRLLPEEEEEEDNEDQQAGNGWGTTSEIVMNGVASIDDGRLSMSWYGGTTPGDRFTDGIDQVLDRAQTSEGVGDGSGETLKQPEMKWVVHEHLEYVPEPKRKFAWLF
ncbi:1-phosphatidylinositol 4-kinase LSB6 [Sporobolomyces koalae]|uniref:1-phosphatidylinositol 4-kinase LSB6 n=1 Tax=Sporobolomyces koalae TaxID=500713 RepID=UPI003170F778